MVWKRKHFNPKEEIARTGFHVALISYISFWAIDLVQPGFVSRYVSVHIFLLAIVAFGLLWSREMDSYRERPLVHKVVALISGIALAMLIWHTSEGLDEYRAALVVIGLATPWLILKAFKK